MASARPITDHDEIREWAEARGGRPACVKGTGGKGDTGMIRLDFPGYSGGDSLQSISWDDWFRQFDENNLALLVQETTSRGQQSNFNKLVSRGTTNARGGRSAGRRSTRRSTGRKTSRGRAASASRSSSRSGSSSRARTSSRSRKTSSANRSGSNRKAAGTRSSGRKSAQPRARKQTSRSRNRQR